MKNLILWTVASEVQRGEKSEQNSLSLVFRFYGHPEDFYSLFSSVIFFETEIKWESSLKSETKLRQCCVAKRELNERRRVKYKYICLIYVRLKSTHNATSRHARGWKRVLDVISSASPFSVSNPLWIGYPLDIKMNCGLNRIEFQFDILSSLLSPKHWKLFANSRGDWKTLKLHQS